MSDLYDNFNAGTGNNDDNDDSWQTPLPGLENPEDFKFEGNRV